MEHRTLRTWAIVAMVGGIVTATVLLVGMQVAQASHPEASLPDSNFEIDTDANLKLNDSAPSEDWASVPPGTSANGAEVRQADKTSGSGDDSFVQGTKEDTAVPTIEFGGIPPNKSDLKNFGVYLESQPDGDRFLNLFWHRVQDPNGTTNMDFEFNQSSVISSNGVTPVRTSGDLLIQYDLSRSGTRPVLFLSRWIDGTEGKTAADCEAASSLPCWDKKVDLTEQGDATGSINTSAISSGESDGLGAVSARTFGEAQVDFNALTGGTNQCVSFGSAYLKSRSSDSFTAALKDFIAPKSLGLNQCATVIIRKQTDPEENPDTTEFGYTKNFPTDPASADTFTLKDDGIKSYNDVLPGTDYTVEEDVLPTGWEFVSVDCSASMGVTPSITGARVTFAIDSNTDILDCTYTNRARGSISIHKEDDAGNALAGAVFTLYHNNPPLEAPRGPAADDPAVNPAVTCTTNTSGDCSMPNIVPGEYWVVETTTPAGHNTAADQRATVTAGQTVPLSFVNPRLFKTIVLVCRESDNSLYSSTVTVDGVSKSSLGSATNEGALCALGGASYGGQLKGNHPANVNIPNSELPLP